MTFRVVVRRTAAAVLSAGVLMTGACAGSSGDSSQPIPGPHGQGIGDPYYPDDGNRGYDVRAYHVSLSYYRSNQRIAATTSIVSKATARLARFDLDLLGMHVLKVTVDGRPATFSR